MLLMKKSVYFGTITCGDIAETKATAALTAMQIRDWDKDAQEFVKKRRQIEAQAQN